MKVRRGECRFCGSVAHGYACGYSNIDTSHAGLHVEVGDDEHCIYCGSTNYGMTCGYNPGDDTGGKKIHVHGHSDSTPNKCIYCGSTSRGATCPWSPTGKHQF